MNELPASVSPAPSESSDLDVTRAQLRATLIGREGAADDRDRILAFLDDHPDAAHRSCAPGHLTGSAVIVDATGSRALMMLHAKIGRWLQMGGHADGDCNLAGVALREATEESGIEGLTLYAPAIDVDAHTVSGRRNEPGHEHLDLRFLVMAPPGAAEVGNDESDALAWVSADELDSLVPAIDNLTAWLVRRALALAPV
ncbi:MAG: NUDIX hydrolase [Candidatus Neomicrothrix subdominans]|jgi:8-oxo-dGTP pyrophosphatase MutT (NUDIX family)